MNTIEEDIAKAQELLDEYKNQPSDMEDWERRCDDILSILSKHIKRARKLRLSLGLLGVIEQIERELKALQKPKPKRTYDKAALKERKITRALIFRDRLINGIIELEENRPTISKAEKMKKELKDLLNSTHNALYREAIEEGLFFCDKLIQNIQNGLYDRKNIRLDNVKLIPVLQPSQPLKSICQPACSDDTGERIYARVDVSWEYQRETITVDGDVLMFFGNGDIYNYW